MIGAWLAMAACAPAPCREGFMDQGGICVPDTSEEDVTIHDLLDALPACVAVAPGEGLDVDGHCADGACVGMTADEVDAALDESPVCTSFFEPQYQMTYVDCGWPRGISASFEDLDADGVPDVDAVAYGLEMAPPYAGATPDGLGIGAGLRCFVDAWGEPAEAWLAPQGEGWALEGLYWSEPSAGVGRDTAAGPSVDETSWIELFPW